MFSDLTNPALIMTDLNPAFVMASVIQNVFYGLSNPNMLFALPSHQHVLAGGVLVASRSFQTPLQAFTRINQKSHTALATASSIMEL